MWLTTSLMWLDILYERANGYSYDAVKIFCCRLGPPEPPGVGPLFALTPLPRDPRVAKVYGCLPKASTRSI